MPGAVCSSPRATSSAPAPAPAAQQLHRRGSSTAPQLSWCPPQGPSQCGSSITAKDLIWAFCQIENQGCTEQKIGNPQQQQIKLILSPEKGQSFRPIQPICLLTESIDTKDDTNLEILQLRTWHDHLIDFTIAGIYLWICVH